jgi:hypothetical protein
VRFSRLQATASTPLKITSCREGAGHGVGLTTAYDPALPNRPTFAAARTGNSVSLNVFVNKTVGKLGESHSMVVSTTGAHLTSTANLSSARVTGAGAIVGSATFRAISGTPTNKAGKLKGHIKTRFDSIGLVTAVSSGEEGTLYRY